MENKENYDYILVDDYIDLDAAADICDNEDSYENIAKEILRIAKVLDDDTATTLSVFGQGVTGLGQLRRQ
ncbi:hypothetical protein HK096_001037 [Nowakowskiella sp. JEL0078]|nr:hypothetical protein HK096_001037 [Nowakowskiella sp. JEL0078]